MMEVLMILIFLMLLGLIIMVCLALGELNRIVIRLGIDDPDKPIKPVKED